MSRLPPRIRWSIGVFWLLLAMACFYTWIAYILLNSCCRVTYVDNGERSYVPTPDDPDD
ncbi:MAG TPA: hypothetical protein VNG33_07240 [Polyangiaceae bacterium]|nr:hypothetical protein [Polyangiaceae bacterium]